MKDIYPFKFLNAYTEEDTQIFFGRDKEIKDLYEMIFESDIVLLYGESGTGKTSLIQCGLARKFQPHEWTPIYIKRGITNLNHSLIKALYDTINKSEGENSKNGNALTISHESNKEGMLEVQSKSFEEIFKIIYLEYFRPIYLIFDQFEELYIFGTKDEQKEFIKNVLGVMNLKRRVKIIFSIREEYLGHLDKFEKAVPILTRKKLRIETMDYEKVKEVIMGATNYEKSNVSLKPGDEFDIIKGIFEKVKGKKITLTIELTYLQVFLDKLYMKITGDSDRIKEAVITKEILNEMGDIEDVLIEFLDEQVKEISQGIKFANSQELNDLTDNIWKILSYFTTLKGTKEPITLKILYTRLPEMEKEKELINKTIQEFENRRIIRKSGKNDSNEEFYEITHDSLALRIAGKRSAEQIALFKILDLIKNKSNSESDFYDLFTEKELNKIEPYLKDIVEKNLISDQQGKLISDSKNEIIKIKKEKVAAQEKGLEIANERTMKEAKLRKAAETSKERAIESENKARRRSRYAAIAAIFAALTAAFAIYYYLNAREAEGVAIKTAGILRTMTDSVRYALNQIEKEQAISKAKELLSYGDSYRNLQEDTFACESYSAGLNVLEDYKQDTLYKKLKNLVDSCDSH